ncbi:MAG: 50S ribosomal protein L13 [Planctomycetes bacterium]|nr:50S ribosomal protein L13 [Planctomycetota bacterium]
MSSFMAKTDADGNPINFEQNWCVIDATNLVVGRLAATVATILRGKHRPQYTPHQDTGDYVIIINAEKVKFTGRKLEQKTYQTYSHYPGGQRIIPASEVMDKHPERIIMSAVKRMMPRSRLGRKQLEKLKIYKGPQHPHQAQQPKEFKM